MKLVSFIGEQGVKVGSLYKKNVIDLREAWAYLLMFRGASIAEAIAKARVEIPDNMVDFIKRGEEVLEKAREGEEFVLKKEEFGKESRLYPAYLSQHLVPLKTQPSQHFLLGQPEEWEYILPYF